MLKCVRSMITDPHTAFTGYILDVHPLSEIEYEELFADIASPSRVIHISLSDADCLHRLRLRTCNIQRYNHLSIDLIIFKDLCMIQK